MGAKSFTSADFLRLLLRPIVRLCLKRSIRFQEFGEIARLVYVECAEQELQRDGHEVNVSRISIATGLQRRDVTRLWNVEPEVKEHTALLHKVLGQWKGDKRFSERSERPRPLTFKGVESEFAQLVNAVSQDLNVYTILFELERLSLVEKKGERLFLIGDTVVPQKDLKRGSELLSNDIQDLITAVDENLFGHPEILNHHVKTHYDNISIEALPRIRQWLLDKGELFHRAARKFISRYDIDINPTINDKKGGGRVALGSFSVTELDKGKKL